jgi:hypothetical protein
MVKELFQRENYPESLPGEIELNLTEEKRAIAIFENTIRKVDNPYETGLLWKSDNFKCPPSYDNALKRLKTIEKKMEKDTNKIRVLVLDGMYKLGTGVSHPLEIFITQFVGRMKFDSRLFQAKIYIVY